MIANKLSTRPPLRWIICATSERWVAAMLMPSMTISLTLYRPSHTLRRQSTGIGTVDLAPTRAKPFRCIQSVKQASVLFRKKSGIKSQADANS